MSKRLPPPTYEPLIADEGANATLPWILFFSGIYEGDSGTTWTPTFTDLTEVGTATITGTYYKITQKLVYFVVTITPETSVSSTAGTTYINNFPLQLTKDGACLAVSGGLGSNAGHCVASNNRIFIPSLSAVTVPATIVGLAVV